MAYEPSSQSVDTLRARVENALGYVAAMVAEREDGATYLPIFFRLEKELAALDEKESAIERARRLARSAAPTRTVTRLEPI